MGPRPAVILKVSNQMARDVVDDTYGIVCSGRIKKMRHLTVNGSTQSRKFTWFARKCLSSRSETDPYSRPNRLLFASAWTYWNQGSIDVQFLRHGTTRGSQQFILNGYWTDVASHLFIYLSIYLFWNACIPTSRRRYSSFQEIPVVWSASDLKVIAENTLL